MKPCSLWNVPARSETRLVPELEADGHPVYVELRRPPASLFGPRVVQAQVGRPPAVESVVQPRLEEELLRIQALLDIEGRVVQRLPLPRFRIDAGQDRESARDRRRPEIADPDAQVPSVAQRAVQRDPQCVLLERPVDSL